MIQSRWYSLEIPIIISAHAQYRAMRRFGQSAATAQDFVADQFLHETRCAVKITRDAPMILVATPLVGIIAQPHFEEGNAWLDILTIRDAKWMEGAGMMARRLIQKDWYGVMTLGDHKEHFIPGAMPRYPFCQEPVIPRVLDYHTSDDSQRVFACPTCQARFTFWQAQQQQLAKKLTRRLGQMGYELPKLPDEKRYTEGNGASLRSVTSMAI